MTRDGTISTIPDDVSGKVIGIVNEVLNEDVDVNSSVDNIGSWDSMAYMAIVACIEDEFEIEIGENNINNFTSIKNIIIEIENGRK